MSPLHHTREDNKGPESCHNSLITLIPLTIHQGIRALEVTSLHKSIITRITKLACRQKLAKDKKRILEPMSQEPQKPHTIKHKFLVDYFGIQLVVSQKREITAHRSGVRCKTNDLNGTKLIRVLLGQRLLIQ